MKRCNNEAGVASRTGDVDSLLLWVRSACVHAMDAVPQISRD